ncbi:Ion transport protein-domain-containing protein [Mortierella sp. GBAus27b]|nr:Ion transport protein-domain-containing protein [Mortierella sp. GBAus27b]
MTTTPPPAPDATSRELCHHCKDLFHLTFHNTPHCARCDTNLRKPAPPKKTKKPIHVSVRQFLLATIYKVVRPPGFSEKKLKDKVDANQDIILEEPELKGSSLYYFDPDNHVRTLCTKILCNRITIASVFLLIVLNLVFLAIEVSWSRKSDTSWGAHWTDWGLMGIFIFYTLEAAAKIITVGMVKPPPLENVSPSGDNGNPRHNASPEDNRQSPIDLRDLSPETEGEPAGKEKEKPLTPFLRCSFNRMDLVALVCFWIDLILMVSGVRDIFIFKSLAALRTLRLINITFGNRNPLRNLKDSIHLLLKISLSIAFLFFIFSLIGLQAFKGSYTRRCVLIADNSVVLEDQFCGGSYKELGSMETVPYITLDGGQSLTPAKGYICPHNYECKDTGEYHGNDLSFDNILTSMVQVYILMTGQTWTDIMYKMMDSEHGWSSIYFVVVILVMNFWILNLFVAVIVDAELTSEEDTKDRDKDRTLDSEETLWRKEQLRKMEFFWVLAIIADLAFQCLPEYKSPKAQVLSVYTAELLFTLVFIIDIGIRYTVWPSEHMKFYHSAQNMFDAFLVVATTIIQIPMIHNSDAYVYLSIFQVMRIYRPIICIPSLRELIQRVIGGWRNLLSLTVFIVVFLIAASVMAGTMFRDVVPAVSHSMNFSDFYVSYLGMYQIFSGENWTDILYAVMSVEMPLHQIILNAIFVIAFYSFANFVLVNMIIAVITENFGNTDDQEKHVEQIKNYVARKNFLSEPKDSSDASKDASNASKDASNTSQDATNTSQDASNETMDSDTTEDPPKSGTLKARKEKQFIAVVSEHLQDYMKLDANGKERREPVGPQSLPLNLPDTVPKEFSCDFFYTEEELFCDDGVVPSKRIHPVYFHQKSPNECPHGLNSDISPFRRIFASDYKFKEFWRNRPNTANNQEFIYVLTRTIFEGFIAVIIFASVIVAVKTTPVWRFHQMNLAAQDQSNVVNIADYVFIAVFGLEIIIRFSADRWKYLKTFWNQIDLLVFVSLCVPQFMRLAGLSNTSRMLRSLKALRALRLIRLSDFIKDTFHAVLIAGFPQLLDATMLCMALLVPFAIYGMRLFAGKFFSCNDDSDSILGINDCVGMFQVPGTNFTMPRVWATPHEYSFNNFWASFLLLLEIVSQDGWVDVMGTARDISGLGLQPRPDASRYNGIFFVVFNLAGGYFVTSLFVAIVIENYSRRTGTAFMTTAQLRWKNLRQFLAGVKKKKVPQKHKKGTFAYFLMAAAVAIGVTLATENANHEGEDVKNYFYFVFLLFFVAEIFVIIRYSGWRAYYANHWNWYNGIVSILALAFTFMRICRLEPVWLIQTQEALLKATLLRLVPRIDNLNRLMMTMAASLVHVAKLLGAWLVVFAVYGIMFMEVFGLTAYGVNGTRRVNFRDTGSTLLMMVRMSTGEGWSSLMHDFAQDKSTCVKQKDYLLSDCGSTPWAYSLFISFNIISMYIFTNMFIAEVMQKFSSVYPTAPVTREDIRSFKTAWDEIDTDKDGYIQEGDLDDFLMKLGGKFNVGEPDTSKKPPKRFSLAWFRQIVDGDTDTPMEAEDLVNMKEKARRDYYFLYMETLWVMECNARNAKELLSSASNIGDASIASEKGVDLERKISFHGMLMILARYKLVEDESAFSIEERLRHRQKMQWLHCLEKRWRDQQSSSQSNGASIPGSSAGPAVTSTHGEQASINTDVASQVNTVSIELVGDVVKVSPKSEIMDKLSKDLQLVWPPKSSANPPSQDGPSDHNSVRSQH